MRMPQEPDYGDPPLDPPTREEQEADAWEYWHQQAIKLEAELHDATLKAVLHHFGPEGANKVTTTALAALTNG